MKYKKSDAKDYARQNLRGIWAAGMTPFNSDLSVDEAGFQHNVRHWVEDLKIDGVFVTGKQGEFHSMSLPERKRSFELAVEAAGKNGATMMSCSDQNLDVVVDLAKHAQAVGADYIVVHAPMLHFFRGHDETAMEYYRYISERVDVGIALWSHPDSGYLMSPELCARIADLPNIVAIKYSVPREMYARLTKIAGHKLVVSSALEEDWLENIVELGWQLYLCSSPPYLLQTKADRRMREYTDLMRGGVKRAGGKRESLNSVRDVWRGRGRGGGSRPPTTSNGGGCSGGGGGGRPPPPFRGGRAKRLLPARRYKPAGGKKGKRAKASGRDGHFAAACYRFD